MTDNKTPTPADNEAQIIADEMPDQLRAEEQNAHLFEHFLEAIEADDTSKAAQQDFISLSGLHPADFSDQLEQLSDEDRETLVSYAPALIT